MSRLRKLAWPIGVGAVISAVVALVAPPVPCNADSLLAAAQLGAAGRFDWWPLLSKSLATVGLPQGASWNDFLVGEDWLIFLLGPIARIAGAWRALAFTGWAGSVFAGVSLFFVARRLGAPRHVAAAGGVLFGLAPFAFTVAAGRPGLQLFGILPWVALASLWIASAGRLRKRRLVVGTVILVAAAWSHVELALFSAELVVIALIVHANRTQWMPTLVPRLGLVAAMGLSFVLVNADTFLVREPNPTIAAPLPEHFALKFSGLFVGGEQHRNAAMRHVTANARAQVLVPEETGRSYLGGVGIGLLVFLGVRVLFALARRRFDPALGVGLACFLIVLAHAPGGAFSLLRLFGVVVPVRLAHVSVVLQLLLLLFAVRSLRRFRGPVDAAACAVVAMFGIWDQVPMPQADAVIRCRAVIESDRAVMEALPSGSAVFVLPVAELDATPGGGGEGHELLRPYLASTTARVSHGGVRGRSSMGWQQRVASLPPAELLGELKRSGFTAVWVSLAHPSGRAWRDGLVAAGAKVAATSALDDSVVLSL